MVMAVHSTTETERRSVVRAAARRVLITAGLTVAGATLTVAFTSSAWADDTSTSSGTGQTSTTASAEHTESSGSTAAPASSDPATEKPSEASEPTQATGKTSTQAAKPKPTKTSTPAENAEDDPAGTLMTTSAATEAEPEPEPVKKSSGGGLLGGLVNTVGGVLNAVTSTVGSVGDAVLKPIVAPIVAPIQHCPGPDVVVTLPDLDSGFDAWPAPATADSRGSTSTVAVVEPVSTNDAESTTQVPVDKPEPARVTPAQPVTVTAPVKQHQPVPAAPAPKPDENTTKVRAGGGGGGGAPGGGAPAAPPCAPAGHSASAHPGQDNNGGRGHFGVLPSADSTTQLRLIGTSRDHAADGAGRDAALPTTSPD
ncbi:hypothetical protein A4R43_32620 [Amycolatopsis albispora]|uniref:Uncharacterized protein n=1 Tax=Amycolatopsis albispora TaxID=1804986 RepID=A0A344LEY0_9PSEU|nr:hypothetical protein A4R43_32620 [Amycolatopsis albispora]